MYGIVFEDQPPVVQSHPNRADIACFVGFVERRRASVSREVHRWLRERGWGEAVSKRQASPLFQPADFHDAARFALQLRRGARPLDAYLSEQLEKEVPRLFDDVEPAVPASNDFATVLASSLNLLLESAPLYTEERFAGVNLSSEALSRTRIQTVRPDELAHINRFLLEEAYPFEIARDERGAPSLYELLDVPVPIESWEVFDRLFAWEERVVDRRGERIATYLGAAVRSFFAQGGRKCYVVRVGDPWVRSASRRSRLRQIEKLIPGYPISFDASPVERETWRGAAHLFGLPDVSFLCLPDLPDAVGLDPEPLPEPEPLPAADEQFVECSDEEPLAEKESAARLLTAPRCDADGYAAWARALNLCADTIYRKQREVQLVASIPIPQAGTVMERDLLDSLVDGGRGPLAQGLGQSRLALASAFVQLVYPWARTPGSDDLPEQLESPDALLVGTLARNALTRGAFRSAANQHLADVYDVAPALNREQMWRVREVNSRGRITRRALAERVSLLGQTPGGWRLLSDATTSLDEAYRQASVNRLVSTIVRAARRVGEDIVFESSGEHLWGRLREGLNTLLAGLLRAGALRGATPEDAFYVRCDRSTMSQNDIDGGRVVAQVGFDASIPVERITVVLAMDDGGRISLLSRGAEEVEDETSLIAPTMTKGPARTELSSALAGVGLPSVSRRESNA